MNYGRLINAVHAQDAKFQASIYQYQQTALTAQREVEDSLVGFLQAQQQAISLQQGVAETARSVVLVKEQFENGLTDFNRVYNTESLLVTQQDQLAQTRGNIAVNLIGVYRALGGGWQSFCGSCGISGGAGVPVTMPATVPIDPTKPPENVPIPVPGDLKPLAAGSDPKTRIEPLPPIDQMPAQ